MQNVVSPIAEELPSSSNTSTIRIFLSATLNTYMIERMLRYIAKQKQVAMQVLLNPTRWQYARRLQHDYCVSASSDRVSNYGSHLIFASSLLVLASCYDEPKYASCARLEEESCGVAFDSDQVITNWSATHSCKPARVYEPKSAQEVLRLLQRSHRSNPIVKLRPVGTALSPNGIGMNSEENLISLSGIDHIHVDKDNQLVTVGAGARVSDVLKALDKHNLTLQNFSSIQEQQMAGWTQVAAHGTGCRLPTVDDMIVRMQLATPTEGLITLSSSLNPRLFSFAKVGLGSLGVVTELTMQCMPKHSLHEHTFSLSQDKVLAEHYYRLRHYRHVRYMWLPYTQDVVVVVSNPTDTGSGEKKSIVPVINASTSSTLPTQSMIDLLLKKDLTSSQNELSNLNFAQLRDRLLNLAPLNLAHIQEVNQAEALFWRNSQDERVNDSTKILGFECGGEQWVLEVCFPIGTLQEATGKDITFVKKLIGIIQANSIAAPCPIEQRWTARSTSCMSPAYADNPDEIFSWVGIIMYLPAGQNEHQKKEITKAFKQYTSRIAPLCEEYNAHAHWAKIEIPSSDDQLERTWIEFLTGVGVKTTEQREQQMRDRLAKRYPVEEFNEYRKALDPKGILSNDLVVKLFGPVIISSTSSHKKK